MILCFLEILKKSANFLQLSATPEASSITIRRSIKIFSPKTESFILSIKSLVLSLNFSIKSTSSSGSLMFLWN